MITLDHLTKRYGATTAVDDLTVQIEPGRVSADQPNHCGWPASLM